MRITIDAIPLLYRSAGVKNYLYYWIRHLRRQAGGDGIRLFPFLGEPDALDHERPAAGRLGAVARLGLAAALNRAPFDFASWISPRADVFHCSKLLYPPRNARLTATIHDLTCWLMPEMHSPANVAAEKFFAERVWKRAGALIAVSEATRKDALRILKLPPGRVHVIHHGVGEEFFQAGEDDARQTALRHGLTRPYALFVGTIEPRKNVGLLLKAWAALPAGIREEFDLILAGPEGWRQQETLARLHASPAGVRYLGYVPERDMPGLFAGAAALVYPSLYEGFGFPVAQAMAAGTPVITSNVSALPEIAQGAASLIDPRSEEELRNALRDVLTSPGRRAQMSNAGRAKAGRFSWARCAAESMAFFENVAE
jgi:alpha-1,3-rhamnosyl/mannosyltransferase